MTASNTALAEVLSYEDERTSGVHPVLPVLRATLRPTSRGKIIGRHPSVREVLGTIEQVAKSSCTVLVTGPSGTGKELVVAALHDASPRAGKNLVSVNCGAIPEALMESELFGHAKGAFTGAHAVRQGLVAAAEGGTLFLDEIGEMPLSIQVKLLRLLQQREYSPVGDSRTLKCNIRVVVATNRDLEVEVAEGRFREDLFYRLNVIHVDIPALKDRASDIPLLVNHFFRVSADRSARSDLEGFTDEAMEALASYDWPGNVRALENAVERCVLLSAGPSIGLSDLPPRLRNPGAPSSERRLAVAPVFTLAAVPTPVPPSSVVAIAEAAPQMSPISAAPVSMERPITPAASFAPVEIAMPDSGIDLRARVEQYENSLIALALEKTGRNKNRAAQLLGVNRTTLVEMIKRKGL